MTQHFDIAVLGSGPGGYIAALKAAQLGARTAVVEKEHLGGTCLNYGCIPSKALLASAELLHKIARAAELGVEVGPATANWAAIQARKDKILKTQRGGISALFKARKVALFAGRGVLDGPGRVVVTAGDGGAQTITADKIILAVGSVPSRIPGWPGDNEFVCTSDEALHWQALPQRLLIVGGGVIGCEFACMMREFGAQVTVVELLPGLLPGLDCQLGQALGEIFRKRGIVCHTDTKVDDLSLKGECVTARLSTGETLEVDKVLVATGRRANTGEIGLESVGLATERGFVRVNDTMETVVRGVYCVGDANGRALLAHAASAHGTVAAENAVAALTGKGAPRSFSAPIPGAVYTFPEIGAVGLSQDEARAKKIPVAVGMFPLKHLGKAQSVNDTEGFIKVLRHRESGALLGVHMLGHNVTESIAAAGALLHQRVSVHEVVETVFAHPTITEALRDAAEDSFGAALHLPPRKVVRVAV